MSKNISGIIAKHLKKLDVDGLDKFKENLCQMNPPLKSSKIEMADLINKSVEDMSKFIVKCHTTRYAKITVLKVLLNLKENQIRMDLNKDFRNGAKGKKKVQTPRKSETASKRKEQLPVNKPSTIKELKAKEGQKMVMKANDDVGPSSKTPKKRARKEQHSDAVSQKKMRLKTNSNQPNKDKSHFVKKHQTKLINTVKPVRPILDGLSSKKLLTDEQIDIIMSNKTSQNQMRELFSFVSAWGDSDKDKFFSILKKLNGPVIRNLMNQ